MAAVSAGDINETTDSLALDDEIVELAQNDNDYAISENQSDNNSNLSENKTGNANDEPENKVISTSARASSADVFIKNSKFFVQILDDKGNGIAGKTVQIKFNGNVTKLTTNSKGYVYYQLTEKGTYTISYTFKHKGYTTVKGSKSITVVGYSKSKFKASNYVAYFGVSNPYTVTLTTGGVSMPNKKVIFKIKGKSYTVKTDSNGKATLNIGFAKGKYTIKYSFKGETNAKSANGSSKITVKKGMPTKIVRMNSVTYKHQTSAPLIFKYKDVRGNAIPYKTIVLKFGSKTYIKKTGKDGIVSFNIKKNKGVYKVQASSYNTDVLIKTSSSYTIKVQSNNLKYYGFWLFGADMKKVNLKDMAKNGVNLIFLNGYAVTLHGKSAVSSFACEAKSLGIKVHIWMSTFHDGEWISPLTNDGAYNNALFNSLIKDAKEYASIKGVSGIHFDYIRFPGTAYKHANGVDAITYFTKTACKALHKMDSSLIVSAAVMPEPSAMKYYYGQDIPEMSKYLDMIVPMVYKGNYGKNSAWIQSVTQQFIKQSQGAIVLTGIQGYYSDSNVKKLPASTLIKDAGYAFSGGANGVIVFRYSLFNLINFNNL